MAGGDSKDNTESWLTKGPESACGTKVVPALTIAWHPDPSRIGHRTELESLLTDGSASLSRLSPSFKSRHKKMSSPLGVKQVSRTALLLHLQPDGHIRLEKNGTKAPLSVDGIDVENYYVWTPERVAQGSVLILGRRVVLVLHHREILFETDESFGLVGNSHGIEKIRHEILRAAQLTCPVVIYGESGTGKELVAQGIHLRSARNKRPWVPVNAGAVSAGLTQAALFGTKRGAYTGADREQKGFFVQAHGSTLFLDEIGNASREMQQLLLRALENGDIQPVGSERPYKVDVRALAATDSDLEADVEAGSFEGPLLFRLSGYSIRIPPLRQRREDIGQLFLSFFQEALDGHHALARETRDEESPYVPPTLVARLIGLDWPGNVRQLRQVVRRLVEINRGRSRLSFDADLEALFSGPPSNEPTAPDDAEPGTPPAPIGSVQPRHAELTDQEIEDALAESQFNVDRACKTLGLSRGTLYRRLRAHPELRIAGEIDPKEIEEIWHRHEGRLDPILAELKVSRKGLVARLRKLGYLL